VPGAVDSPDLREMAPALESRCPKTILVVEDDADIRDSLKEALEWEGFLVFTAGNGREGLSVLGVVPTPCMILLDLMMPVMNGWEFAACLAKDPRLHAIPVVVLSAFGEPAARIAARAFIRKPIDLGLLLAVTGQHCGHGAG
jgi:CheY-like chemotaxis protein